MRLSRSIVSALLALAAATAPMRAISDPNQTGRPEVKGQPKVDHYIHSGLPFLFKGWGPIQFRLLPGLQSITTTEQPSEEGDGQIDYVHEFEFVDMKVWLWCAPKGSSRCLVEQVTVLGPSRNTRFGIRVGQTTTTLQSILGTPHINRDGVWHYPASTTSAVYFFIEEDRIRFIVWSLYTG